MGDLRASATAPITSTQATDATAPSAAAEKAVPVQAPLAVNDVAARDGTSTPRGLPGARNNASVGSRFASHGVLIQEQLEARVGSRDPTVVHAMSFVEKIIGERCDAIADLRGGVSNRVQLATLASGRNVVMRSGTASKLAEYQKEWFANDSAARTGKVPVGEMLAIGQGDLDDESVAYLLQEMLPGRCARDVIASSPELRGPICHAMGKILRALRDIPTRGFGDSYDATTNQFSHESWPQAIDAKVEESKLTEILVPQGVIDGRQVRRIIARMDALKELNFSPVLAHGDPHLGNANAMGDGRIAGIFDWGNAASTHPLQDLAEAHAWNYSKEDLASLRDGYGVTANDLAADAETIASLALLRMLTSARWFVKANPQIAANAKLTIDRVLDGTFASAVGLSVVG